MRVAVRKEEVDNQATDREQEDEKTPEYFREYLVCRLQDFDCYEYVSLALLADKVGDASSERMWGKRTEDDDIENEHNEADDAAAGAISPCVAVALNLDGSRAGEGKHGNQQREEREVEHGFCICVELLGTK